MTPEQLERLTNVFRGIFSDPELEIRDDLTAADVPGWDSFNHINLVMQIEEDFDLRFTTDEIAALENVGDLKRLMKSKLA